MKLCLKCRKKRKTKGGLCKKCRPNETNLRKDSVRKQGGSAPSNETNTVEGKTNETLSVSEVLPISPDERPKENEVKCQICGNGTDCVKCDWCGKTICDFCAVDHEKSSSVVCPDCFAGVNEEYQI
jgi:hypothetical protein